MPTSGGAIRTRSSQSISDSQPLTTNHQQIYPNHFNQTQPGSDQQLQSHSTRSTHEPNEIHHPHMTPSAGFLNHPYPFSHEHHTSDTAYHPHHNHLILSPSDHSCSTAPASEIAPETSSDTFFASHKAHRSFRGVVEKFHQNPHNPPFDQSFDSTQWAQWPPQNDHGNLTSPLNKSQDLDVLPSTNPDSAPKSQAISPLPAAPYRTRSLVHRLVNQPDPTESKPPVQPSDSLTPQPFFYDCLSSSQFALSRSAGHLNSNPIDAAHDLRSVLNKDEIPADSRRIQSTLQPNRNKDGLPSNSHHLLNSPELKTAQIHQNTRNDLIQNRQVNPTHTDDTGPASEPQSDTNQLTQPSSQSLKSTRATASKRTTPQKGKASSNHHLEPNSTDQPNHPPSDDAASILLTLSRHEPPKHGMSLRRGRGGASSRADSQPTEPSDSRPQPPSTPNEPRYRTRSQTNEEVQPDDQPFNQNSPLALISSQHPDSRHVADSSNIAHAQSHLVPSNLGYGFPTGLNQSLISLSGSTSTSTCTSRSNTGDGSALNLTPGQESTFSLQSLINRPQTSLNGRIHFKASGVSTPMSMTHFSAANSLVYSGAAMMDDDAKSSFSISTQATSLISPPGYFTRRTFPPEVPIDSHFPRLYRSFYVSSAFGDREPIKSQAESYKIPVMKNPPNSNFNTPAHGYLDLYTPRYVKGVGAEKLGLCCICAEPKERGGGDTALWLKMKVSSYSYHLSFFHGINNADGLPFSPPVEIRLMKRCHVAANEKLELKEGRCHQCNKWVPMEGVKMQEVKVPELFWWKHAKSCHKSRLAGECHVHIPDEIFDLVTRQQPYNGSGGYLPVSSCSTPYSYYGSNDLTTSNSSYGSRYHPASPAPTCASSVSQSGGSRVHPSVAAQRASAGRVYKRKASNSSLSGKRRADSIAGDPSDSPQASNWHSLSHSAGTAASTNSTQSIYQHFIQHPQSPTPTQPAHPIPNGRKTRRSNMLS